MDASPATPPLDQLHACPACDLLLAAQPLNRGQDACCPRCGEVVRSGRADSLNRAFWISSAGLALFAPAMGLPLLSMTLLGVHEDASLTEAIIALFQAGFPEVASVVAVSALIAPFLNLWLMFGVSWSLKRRYRPRILPSLLRLNHRIREWSMLEVFLLGILVSIIKLADMSELVVGLGLYCFIGLMLCTLLLESAVDEHDFWQALGGEARP
ncbi:MAG: paraquat-inducible protein A [Gammaproteobacteria bacterium]|nr:paraquat-inducible protein A [Gammaproteobacteria bacterium]